MFRMSLGLVGCLAITGCMHLPEPKEADSEAATSTQSSATAATTAAAPAPKRRKPGAQTGKEEGGTARTSRAGSGSTARPNFEWR